MANLKIASSSEIKIEKGVPMPVIRGPGHTAKYPWRVMEIGDSFFVEGKTPRVFASQMATAANATGRKFKSRSVDGGVRVWRIS